MKREKKRFASPARSLLPNTWHRPMLMAGLEPVDRASKLRLRQGAAERVAKKFLRAIDRGRPVIGFFRIAVVHFLELIKKKNVHHLHAALFPRFFSCTFLPGLEISEKKSLARIHLDGGSQQPHRPWLGKRFDQN